MFPVRNTTPLTWPGEAEPATAPRLPGGGEDRRVADVFALLKLRPEQALDQVLGVSLLLRPVNQAVCLQRIRAHLDFLEVIGEPVGLAGLANPAENFLDALATAKFLREKRQVGLAGRRRVGIEEERTPALLTDEIRKVLLDRRDGDVQSPQPDEAPRADDIGNDFKG